MFSILVNSCKLHDRLCIKYHNADVVLTIFTVSLNETVSHEMNNEGNRKTNTEKQPLKTIIIN